MTIQEIINAEFESGLISEPPKDCAVFIIVDTDGSIVSNWVTHEFLEDFSNDDNHSYIIKRLMSKRDEVRNG